MTVTMDLACLTDARPHLADDNVDYAVFGGVLRTGYEFPELALVSAADAARAPDWTFDVAWSEPPNDERFEIVGERQLGPETYRLLRGPSRFRLEYSHAGCFDIAKDGTHIIWYHRPSVAAEIVRAVVAGPAIALALEIRGVLCLHGSCVSIGGNAVAFVGPKHYGKSTIAAALTAAGAQLVGDDLIAVAPGPPSVVWPGVASLRLWSDSVAALADRELSGRILPGLKTTIVGFAEENRLVREAPLAAIYVLAPSHRGETGDAAWRTIISPSGATIALAQQAKLADPLVGLSAAAARLANAGAIAAQIPVWTLHVVRDFARLDALVTQVVAWTHADAHPGDLHHKRGFA